MFREVVPVWIRRRGMKDLGACERCGGALRGTGAGYCPNEQCRTDKLAQKMRERAEKEALLAQGIKPPKRKKAPEPQVKAADIKAASDAGMGFQSCWRKLSRTKPNENQQTIAIDQGTAPKNYADEVITNKEFNFWSAFDRTVDEQQSLLTDEQKARRAAAAGAASSGAGGSSSSTAPKPARPAGSRSSSSSSSSSSSGSRREKRRSKDKDAPPAEPAESPPAEKPTVVVAQEIPRGKEAAAAPANGMAAGSSGSRAMPADPQMRGLMHQWLSAVKSGDAADAGFAGAMAAARVAIAAAEAAVMSSAPLTPPQVPPEEPPDGLLLLNGGAAVVADGGEDGFERELSPQTAAKRRRIQERRRLRKEAALRQQADPGGIYEDPYGGVALAPVANGAAGWDAMAAADGMAPMAPAGMGLDPTAAGGAGLVPVAIPPGYMQSADGMAPMAPAGMGLDPTAAGVAGLVPVAVAPGYMQRGLHPSGIAPVAEPAGYPGFGPGATQAGGAMLGRANEAGVEATLRELEALGGILKESRQDRQARRERGMMSEVEVLDSDGDDDDPNW